MCFVGVHLSRSRLELALGAIDMGYEFGTRLHLSSLRIVGWLRVSLRGQAFRFELRCLCCLCMYMYIYLSIYLYI